MRKVLIWDLNFELENSGGPAGYLYNIKKFIDSNDKRTDIVFLSDVYTKVTKKNNNELVNCSKKIKNPLFVALTDIYRTLRFLRNKTSLSLLSKVDLNNYDVIHFHSPIDLYLAFDVIRDFKGIIMLTSHSPESMASEIVNHIYNCRKSCLKHWSYSYLSKAEYQAFERADYIMFPTPYSSEPYFKDEKLKSLLLAKHERIVYCPTSILDIDYKQRDDHFFQKLCNIPSNTFHVVYIGRHNVVKGYKDLKHIAQKAIQKDANMYFIIAGKEEPITGLSSKNWIELGWTNNAAEIINNADVFILPNRETYFDLIALEVLRAGTPIIMSRTGGNKYFEDITQVGNGIFLFDLFDEESCLRSLKIIKKAKQTGLISKYRDSNRKLWLENFRIERYLVNYRKIIDGLNYNDK